MLILQKVMNKAHKIFVFAATVLSFLPAYAEQNVQGPDHTVGLNDKYFSVGALPANDWQGTALFRTQVCTSLGGGQVRLLDQYLSDNMYQGISANFSREFTVGLKRHSNMWSYFYYSITYSPANDLSRSSIMHYLMLHFDYNHYFKCFQNNHFSILAGPGVYFDFGGLYKPSNSNNPAQLKSNLSLSASLQASYRFRIGNYPMSVRYNMNMALLGMTFAPDYGMLYYKWFMLDDERYIGSFAWLGNSWAMVHRFSVDFYTSRKVQLRLSYTASFDGYYVNGLESRLNSHILSLGIILRRAYLNVQK